MGHAENLEQLRQVVVNVEQFLISQGYGVQGKYKSIPFVAPLHQVAVVADLILSDYPHLFIWIEQQGDFYTLNVIDTHVGGVGALGTVALND